jgi:deoxyadenosine/deoxycytidine kinase
LEGPSAVGKSTLAATLGEAAGAAVLPEINARDAPPIPESAAWFVARSAERWHQARVLARTAPLVVLDGDALKGLWYNWIYADQGWPTVETLAPLYRAAVADGRLGVPELYVMLGASLAELSERRQRDSSRRRSNFELHLRLVEPQRDTLPHLR